MSILSRHTIALARPQPLHAARHYNVIIKAHTPPSDFYTNLNLLVIPKDADAPPSLHMITGPIAHTTWTDVYCPYDRDTIESIIITPQSGEWSLRQVEMRHGDNNPPLVFRQKYNSGKYLEPLELVSELDPAMKLVWDREYDDFKRYIVATSIKMTVAGTIATYALTTPDKSLAFAIGGGMGLLYAMMLQDAVDKLGGGPGVILNTTMRQLILFIVAAAFLTHYKNEIHEDNMVMLFGFMGFVLTRLGYFSRGKR